MYIYINISGEKVFLTLFINVESFCIKLLNLDQFFSESCVLLRHLALSKYFRSHMTVSLQHEVDLSRKECPFVIKPKIQRPSTTAETEDMDTDMDSQLLFALFPVCSLWNFKCTTCLICFHCCSNAIR